MSDRRDHIPLSLRLLKRFCPAHLYEEIEGDLIQQYHRDVNKYGKRTAQRRLTWNVLRFFRPGIILRHRLSLESNHAHMFRNHLVLAKRNIMRNKVFSLIHVLGLSASVVVCLLIFQYVRFELSYEDFHQDAENIFRVSTKVSLQNEIINHETNTYEGIGNALKEDFPESEVATSFSFFSSDKSFVRYEDGSKTLRPLQSYKALHVDSLFLKVFSFPLFAGDGDRVLRDPYSALVSEKIADQYFSGNPVGRILELYDGTQHSRYKITGILKDVPSNSHVKFDFIVRGEARGKNFWNGDIGFWDWGGQTYVRLANPKEKDALEKKLNALAVSNNGLKRNKDDYGKISAFELQPLRDIHLYSHLSEELEVNGSAVIVFALIVLAGIIILVAWVNYINLSTAMAEEKSQSIAIRKVIGASRRNLARQTLTESGVYNILAVVIALIVVHLLFPYYAEFAGTPKSYSTLYSIPVFIGIVTFVLLSTVIAGGYPAWVIASFDYVRSTIRRRSPASLTFRKALVVFQFFAATVLIITTVVAYQQLSFMKNKDLGINIEQVIVIRALNFDKEKWSARDGGFVVDSTYLQKAELFKNDLRSNATFIDATSVSHLPGQLPNWGSEFKAISVDAEKAYRLVAMGIDYDFLSTFQLKIIAGRNFSPDFPADRGNEGRRAVLVNEAASKLLGFKSPNEAVHNHISTYWGADYEIIGVVNSFHQLSVKENLQPIYFILQPRALDYFAVHYRGENVQHALSALQKTWAKYFPDYPFDYFFLDQYFDYQYQTDQKFSSIVGVFSGLAVFMACLGLFGLTSYAIVQRTKEIGIRKVMGASVTNVIGLFTRDFVKLILLSNLLAIPVVYLGISRWLQGYAYKITVGWWFFIVPAIVIVSIAVVTISLQTIKVALRNPVQSLKHE